MHLLYFSQFIVFLPFCKGFSTCFILKVVLCHAINPFICLDTNSMGFSLWWYSGRRSTVILFLDNKFHTNKLFFNIISSRSLMFFLSFAGSILQKHQRSCLQSILIQILVSCHLQINFYIKTKSNCSKFQMFEHFQVRTANDNTKYLFYILVRFTKKHLILHQNKVEGMRTLFIFWSPLHKNMRKYLYM